VIPTVGEMILELNDLFDVLIYKSSQPYQWGIIWNRKFIGIVDERNPSDGFLQFYIERCSS
jgi:hypothetical protein